MAPDGIFTAGSVRSIRRTSPAILSTLITPATPPAEARNRPDSGLSRSTGLNTEPLIRVRGLRTRRGKTEILHGVDLDVAEGEFVAIVGPSGCGKSTLLRLIGGLDSPTAGSITLDGQTIRAHDDSTAIAFQEPRLLPWRPIAQNVALGLPRGVRGRQAKERVAELLNLVGLTHAADQRPREVSGGMAQRAKHRRPARVGLGGGGLRGFGVGAVAGGHGGAVG